MTQQKTFQYPSAPNTPTPESVESYEFPPNPMQDYPELCAPSTVQYIDPDSHAIRSDYPDFLVQKDDGTYVIVEVKGDNLIDAPVVLAKKAFAEQMAAASGMTYEMIKGSDADAGRYGFLLEGAVGRAEQVRLQ